MRLDWAETDKLDHVEAGTRQHAQRVLVVVASQLNCCLVNVVLEEPWDCRAVHDWFCEVSRYVDTYTRLSYKDFLFQKVNAKFYPR